VVGDGIEKASDYEGVLYVDYDRRGAWTLEVARECEQAGLSYRLAGCL
jgi:hypothetical protein